MDWFDIPIVPGPGPGRDLSPSETAAALVCLVLLPLVDLGLVTVTDLSKRPDVAMLWLPGVFTALAVLVCRGLRIGAGRSIANAVGCLWWCFLASAALVVIDVLVFPF